MRVRKGGREGEREGGERGEGGEGSDIWRLFNYTHII